MMSADVVDDLNGRVLDVRAALAGRSLLRFMTPINLEQQRQMVLDDVTHLPAFSYAPIPADVADLFDAAAAAASDVPSVWHQRIAQDWRDTAAMWRAASSHDAAAITSASVASSGVPSPGVCAAAADMLSTSLRREEAAGVVSAGELAVVFNDVFAAVGMDGWMAAIDVQASARVTVNASMLSVSLRAGAMFSVEDAWRLVVHELGTHALRGFNGATQKLSVLATGTPGYLATEEGLAAWHELQYSTPDPVVATRYALRVLAVPAALDAGWSEVFAEMCEHTSPADAFEITRRTKRGFADVSAPGAHTKDHVYLSGMLEVERHLAAHPEDHRRLCAGKVAVSDLGVLDESDLVEGPVSVDDVVAAAGPVFERHGLHAAG